MKGSTEIQIRPINQDDFTNTIQHIKPVVAQSEIDKFLQWKDEFGG